MTSTEFSLKSSSDKPFSLNNYYPNLSVVSGSDGRQFSYSYVSYAEENDIESEDRSAENLQNLLPCLELAGEWIVNRFTNFQYIDHKPMPHYIKRINWNEMEQDGILSDRIIASCSSCVGRSPITQKYAFRKCVLVDMMLNDITILKYHNYLQYLDLSWNRLEDLTPLGQLPFLIYLDVSYNNLKKLLDFKPPLNLTFANFSHNFIKEMCDLSEFNLIVYLDISNNQIKHVHESIKKLRFLDHFNISDNNIAEINHIGNLRIRQVSLKQNTLFKFDLINNSEIYQYLTYINLNNNFINSLYYFQFAYNLESLELVENRIKSLLELYNLEKLRYLVHLNLQKNPITSLSNYLTACLLCCKRLFTLDGQSVDVEMRSNVQQKFHDNQYKAQSDHSILVMLNQLAFPRIGTDVFAFDNSLALIMVLVGPPGSNKTILARNFCKLNGKYCCYGVSHTTRPKTTTETYGVEYYFVNDDEFKKMAKNGDFLTVFEFNGHSYGLSHTELSKCNNKVLVLQMDIRGALTLRLSGLNPKFILAIPTSEYVHMKLIQKKYILNSRNEIVRQEGEFEDNYKEETNFRQLLKESINVKMSRLQKVINDLSENHVMPIFDEDKSCWLLEGCNSIRRKSCDEKSIKKDRASVSFQDCGGNNVCTCWKCPNLNITEENLKKLTNLSDLAIEMEIKDTKSTIHSLFDENLAIFYENILKMRENILELHWSNPGLFQHVIFTNNKENFQQLKTILKQLITDCKYFVKDVKIDEEFLEKRREILSDDIFKR